MFEPVVNPGLPELLSASLPDVHTWSGRPTADDLAPLPNSPAVYLLIDEAARPIQLATTQALRRLLLGRLVEPQPSPSEPRPSGNGANAPSEPRPSGSGPAEPRPSGSGRFEAQPTDGGPSDPHSAATGVPAELDIEPPAMAGPTPRRARTDLAAITRGVRWRPLVTAFEGRWWYYRLAREVYPREYRKLVSFGPAWFLHVDWAATIPEIRVSERIWEQPGEFLGPWPTHRSCQEALEGLWDLFDLCRYPEQVRRAPHGKRCAYAEMGRCDAPCDGSAPLPAYEARCRAAWRFAWAPSAAAEWATAAAEQMQAAAAALNFERAGQLKQQRRFAERWRSEWAPRLRPAAELNYLLALPATRRKAWKVLLFRMGALIDGPVMPDRRLCAELPKWLATELAGLRAQQGAAGVETSAVVRMEQTWLVAHLLFSREAESSIIVPLDTTAPPPDVPELLAARMAELRAAPSGAQETGEGGPGPRTT
ncbi:MAG: hypothetical protein AB1716_08075 [Planctomycetota bacterium]